MNPPLRVLVVGATDDETEALRREVGTASGLEIVATHVLDRSGARQNAADASYDAVVLSRAAAARWTGGPRTTRMTGERSARDSRAKIVEALTARERDVLALVSDGAGNRAIAQALGISEHTVKFHLAAVFGKLSVSNRTKAIQRGLQLGLIEI